MPKGVVEYMVKSLVEKPGQVRIVEKTISIKATSERKESSKIMLEIHVDKDDLGKVIGRGGKTIQTMRAVVGLLFSRQDLLVDVAR